MTMLQNIFQSCCDFFFDPSIFFSENATTYFWPCRDCFFEPPESYFWISQRCTSWSCGVFFFRPCRDIYFVWVDFFLNMPWLYFHLYNIFFDQAAFFLDHSATYFWLCCDIIFERAPICFWITPCFFDFASFFSTKHQTTFDHAVSFLKHSAKYLKIPWRIF